MQHWLPYDEERLYALLGARPRRRLALAARRHPLARRPRDASRDGTRPTLARELVAPWKGQLRTRSGWPCSRRARCGRSPRATSRSTSSSTRCTRTRFPTTRRRSSASRAASSSRRCGAPSSRPCRSAGSTACPRDHAAREAEATLRAHASQRARATGQAMPGLAGRSACSRRQLRQLPRWLNQTRYNGPPPIKQPRAVGGHRVELLQQRGALRRRHARSPTRATTRGWPTPSARGEIGVLGRPAAARRAARVRSRAAAPAAPRARPTTRPSRPTGASSPSSRGGQPQLRQALRADGGLRARPAPRAARALASPGRPGPRVRARPTTRPSPATAAPSPTSPPTRATGTVDVYVGAARKRERLRPAARGAAERAAAVGGRELPRLHRARRRRAGPSRFVRRDLRTGRTVEIPPGDGDAFEPASRAPAASSPSRRWPARTAARA